MENVKKSVKRNLKAKLLILVGVVLILLGVVSIVAAVVYGKYFAYLALYPYAMEMVADLGINIYLSKIIALFLTIGLWLAVFKLLLSFSGRKREIGFSVLLGLFVVQSLGLYIVNLDRPVALDGQIGFCTRNQITGKVEFSERSFFDAFGQKAKECTHDEIRQLRIQSKYLDGEIPLLVIGNWFGTEGNPLVYYYKDNQGELHFRYMGGYALTGEKWQQVTKEALEIIRPDLQSQFQRTKGSVLKKDFDERPNLKTWYKYSPLLYLFFFVFLNIVFWVVFLKVLGMSYIVKAGLIGLIVLFDVVAFCGIDYSSSWAEIVVLVLIVSLGAPFAIAFFKGFVAGMNEKKIVP